MKEQCGERSIIILIQNITFFTNPNPLLINFIDQSENLKMDWMIAVLLLSLLLQPSSPLVRTLEVSPRVEANHDTFLYLCSLDVNEQNIGVVAYRNYQRHYFFKTWLRGILPFTLDGEQGSLDGREQPKFWTRTKGCSCETPCVFFYILFLCYFHCLLLTPPHHAFFFFIFFFSPLAVQRRSIGLQLRRRGRSLHELQHWCPV